MAERVSAEQARLAPIKRDESFDRTYIPLPDGWEIQTKGKGSSFRIAKRDRDGRHLVTDEYLHEPLEAIARACHATIADLSAKVERLRKDALDAARWRAAKKYEFHFSLFVCSTSSEFWDEEADRLIVEDAARTQPAQDASKRGGHVDTCAKRTKTTPFTCTCGKDRRLSAQDAGAMGGQAGSS